MGLTPHFTVLSVDSVLLRRREGSNNVLCAAIPDIVLSRSTLQLTGLQILEVALKHVHKKAASSSDWLKAGKDRWTINLPGGGSYSIFSSIDLWLLLHLDTLFPPQPYLRPEDVNKLEWSDTPAKVHIASARLDLYDSLAQAEHDGAAGPKPDPELLRLFLWSKDHGVCTRAFNWCLVLVPIGQSDRPGDANSTRMFIPETMGYEWVAHFTHVLCKGEHWESAASWDFLKSGLVPKWIMLPSSWRHDFASALLFTVVQPPEMDGLPAYQCLAKSLEYYELQEFLPFLATLLELKKCSLPWDSITSFENWLAKLSESRENLNAHAQMEGILATRKQQVVKEIHQFFAELPMASEWLEENLELLAELPMADEWAEEILGFLAELPMAGESMNE